MEYGASAVFPCGQSTPSIQTTTLPHKSISPDSTVRQPDSAPSVRPMDKQLPRPSRACAGARRFGQSPAVDRRTVSVSWLVNACRAQLACEFHILPRISVISLRRDWRSASRTTRGCAGYASTMRLTPHVRLAYARIACSCLACPGRLLGVGLRMRLSIDVGHDWHASRCFLAAEFPPTTHMDRVLIGRGRRGRSLSRWGHFSRDFVRNPSCRRYNRGVGFNPGSAGSTRGDAPVSWRTFVAEFHEGLDRDRFKTP